MGRLIEGDDGMPAEEVGSWAKEKHGYLSTSPRNLLRQADSSKVELLASW